jgi:hypothetical protein
MVKEDVFYHVMGWNPSTLNFDEWLGTATPETIENLGTQVRIGSLAGYEAAGRHPTGWGIDMRGLKQISAAATQR